MPRRPPKHVRKRISLKKQRQLAEERLEILADHIAKSPDSEFVRKWIKLIVRISRKWKVPVPKSLQDRFCYECYRLWRPGKTFAVRVKKGKSVLICACSKEYPYKQKVFKA